MAQPTYTLEELSRKVDAISEFLNEKTDRNLLNLNTVGQAIIDRKVEVEALLQQNGYVKFTWKEGNKIASLTICWGLYTESLSATDYRYWATSFDTVGAVSIVGADSRYLNWLCTTVNAPTFDKNIIKTKFLCGQDKITSGNSSEMYAFAVGT